MRAGIALACTRPAVHAERASLPTIGSTCSAGRNRMSDHRVHMQCGPKLDERSSGPHPMWIGASLAVAAVHGARAGVTRAVTAVHGVRAGVALAVTAVHGVRAGVSLAVAAVHGVRAGVSLAVAAVHGARAGVSLAAAGPCELEQRAASSTPRTWWCGSSWRSCGELQQSVKTYVMTWLGCDSSGTHLDITVGPYLSVHRPS
jgi:hypothetical protein